MLLEAGADKDGVDMRGRTPLLAALKAKDDALQPFIRILLKAGASVWKCDTKNNSALHYECDSYGNQNMVADMLKHGASLEAKNQKGETPLMKQVKRDCLECVTTLLDHGANMDTEDVSGMTPFQCAISRGNSSLCSAFIERGADPKTVVPPSGLNALCFFDTDLDGRVKAFVEAGVDPNHITSDSLVPLSFAIDEEPYYTDDDYPLIKALLKHGADPNLLLKDGEDDYTTPLISAVRSRAEDCSADNDEGDRLLKALLEGGGDVNFQTPDGTSAFIEAVNAGCECFVFQMLRHGADVHRESAVLYGGTVLHLAVGNNNTKLVEILLDAGADIHWRRKDGYTPIHLAYTYSYMDMVRLLASRGATNTPSSSQPENDCPPIKSAVETRRGSSKRVSLQCSQNADFPSDRRDGRGGAEKKKKRKEKKEDGLKNIEDGGASEAGEVTTYSGSVREQSERETNGKKESSTEDKERKESKKRKEKKKESSAEDEDGHHHHHRDCGGHRRHRRHHKKKGENDNGRKGSNGQPEELGKAGGGERKAKGRDKKNREKVRSGGKGSHARHEGRAKKKRGGSRDPAGLCVGDFGRLPNEIFELVVSFLDGPALLGLHHALPGGLKDAVLTAHMQQLGALPSPYFPPATPHLTVLDHFVKNGVGDIKASLRRSLSTLKTCLGEMTRRVLSDQPPSEGTDALEGLLLLPPEPVSAIRSLVARMQADDITLHPGVVEALMLTNGLQWKMTTSVGLESDPFFEPKASSWATILHGAVALPRAGGGRSAVPWIPEIYRQLRHMEVPPQLPPNAHVKAADAATILENPSLFATRQPLDPFSIAAFTRLVTGGDTTRPATFVPLATAAVSDDMDLHVTQMALDDSTDSGAVSYAFHVDCGHASPTYGQVWVQGDLDFPGWELYNGMTVVHFFMYLAQSAQNGLAALESRSHQHSPGTTHAV